MQNEHAFSMQNSDLLQPEIRVKSDGKPQEKCMRLFIKNLVWGLREGHAICLKREGVGYLNHHNNQCLIIMLLVNKAIKSNTTLISLTNINT